MSQEDLEAMLQADLKPQPEISEAIKEMFRDSRQKETDKWLIDQKADLSDTQLKNLAVCDFLSSLGHFKNLDKLTHSIKTLSVSKNRKGRMEVVEMAKGINERRSNMGFMSRMLGNQGP